MSVDFFRTYSQLISLSPDAPSEKFYTTEDYSKLQSLGPSLPKLNYSLPKASGSVAASTVTLSFKSIRPPFKFSTQLENVEDSEIIYTLKTRLVETVPALSSASVTPSDLKFMIKSKVLTDSSKLADVAQGESQLSVTVMVSAPAPKPVAEDSSDPMDVDPSTAAPMAVSAAGWEKIQKVLEEDLGSEQAAVFLAKFKAAV